MSREMDVCQPRGCAVTRESPADATHTTGKGAARSPGALHRPWSQRPWDHPSPGGAEATGASDTSGWCGQREGPSTLHPDLQTFIIKKSSVFSMWASPFSRREETAWAKGKSPVKDHLCGIVVLGRLLCSSSPERTEMGQRVGVDAELSCRFAAGMAVPGGVSKSQSSSGVRLRGAPAESPSKTLDTPHPPGVTAECAHCGSGCCTPTAGAAPARRRHRGEASSAPASWGRACPHSLLSIVGSTAHPARKALLYCRSSDSEKNPLF